VGTPGQGKEEAQKLAGMLKSDELGDEIPDERRK